jgi:hypothetical protein
MISRVCIKFSINVLSAWLALLVLSLVASGQEQGPLIYVRHMERVYYPPLAIQARIEGTVKLNLTIAPVGRVLNAVGVSQGGVPKPPELLEMTSISFVKRWTFGCFNCLSDATYEHVLTFVYRLDPPSIAGSTVVMDLPDRVTLTATTMVCDHCPALTPALSFIEPGHSVGLVVLGETRERLEFLTPVKAINEYPESAPDCEARTEMSWSEPNGPGGLSVFLRNGAVFQIESATPRYSTKEGVTVGSSPSALERHFKRLEAYVLDPTGDQESGFHDLNYWIDREQGIAFELAYYPKARRRAVSKIIVFTPHTDFLPQGCIPPTQRWFESPSYTFFDK